MSKTSDQRTGWSLIGSVGSALASAACCTLPLILVSLGISGVWLSSLSALEPYRLYFIVLSLGLLSFGFYKGYRRLKEPDCSHSTKKRTKYTLATAGVLVIGLISSPLWLAAISTQATNRTGDNPELEHVVLEVESMTCSSCGIRIRMVLGRVKGVKDARVYATKARIAVQYNPAQTSVEAIVKAVEEAGYSARVVKEGSAGLANFMTKPSGPDMETVNVEELREAFNDSKNNVRLITILSPTCPGCVTGHEIVSRVFEQYDNKHLKGFIVWLPMLAGDNASVAKEQAQQFQDTRIVLQGWDADHGIGNLFKETLDLNGTAWDVYLVYEPGVVWEGEAPPEPTFWMHQLATASGADPDKLLCINPLALSRQVGKILNQTD